MITVRMRPLAPTNDPATINTLLNSSRPAKAAAIPEKELSKDITTGISPPPIGKTKPMPPSNTKTNNTVKNSKVGIKKGVMKTEYRRKASEI